MHVGGRGELDLAGAVGPRWTGSQGTAGAPGPVRDQRSSLPAEEALDAAR